MIKATRAPPQNQMVVRPKDIISAMRHTAKMISHVAISQFIKNTSSLDNKEYAAHATYLP
jgi:hypothetical protein